MISECVLNEALFAIHSQGFFNITVEDAYTTTDNVATLLGGHIHDKFPEGNQCRLIIYTIFPAPSAEWTTDGSSSDYLKVNFAVQIKCQKSE